MIVKVAAVSCFPSNAAISPSLRLGHSKIGTTMDTYGHVLQEVEQSAATYFETLFKND
ncbi:hypothetical protein [Paraliobacillus zengyii]|uniref:hypothetical protein n=1 Tax=Paraliobacillus zengyii TaxID=2213194 RepID=UPI0013A6A467|nr:hypothetical protein [Paraliobacillus zengyii]